MSDSSGFTQDPSASKCLWAELACHMKTGSSSGDSFGEHHLDFEPVDTSKTEDALKAAETACQLAIQQIPQEVEVTQELLRYPEGEGDAVPITERDLEELQPGKFLGNNIVDFYIRFLQRRLPPENAKLFYFFNSFFFQKLLQSTTPTHIDPCRVDYEQLQRWTEKVNLFEKDYVFIPILKSSHWSLLIMCHLNSLTRAPDEMMRFPCVVHLDPIEGQHESFEGLIRSYVLQAWMERFEPSIDKDQLLALYQMKYVQAKVPQQANSHDCGLYVLNYIETFLMELTSPNFTFASSERGVHFRSPHFGVEVLAKRRHIEKLILELMSVFQERTRKHIAMKNLVQKVLQASQNLRSFLNPKGSSEALDDRIKDVKLVSPTISNNEGCEITHASNHEDSMDVPHQQSTLKSRGNNEPWNYPQLGLGFVEYENRSESLPSKQQHVESELRTIGPTNFKGPIFEAKDVSIQENSIHVQHGESSKTTSLNYEQLDGLKLKHVGSKRITKDFSSKLEELPHKNLCEALKEKNKRGKNMTHEETTLLLLCKVEGGRFCKRRRGAMDWNLISEEIEKKLESQPSANQCRLRYDTLLKAYKTYKKHCMKSGKTFSSITKEERLDMKLATTLSEEWYTTIGKICDQAKSRKRIKITLGVRNDLHQVSLYDSPSPNPPSTSNGTSFEDGVVILDNMCGTSEVTLHNSSKVGVFNFLNKDLQSTLLYVVQEWWSMPMLPKPWNKIVYSLEDVCGRLAILQDREPREILNYVLKLRELKFVSLADKDFQERNDLVHIQLWRNVGWLLKAWVYEEVSREVLQKNPHLKTYYNHFPIEQSSLQYVKVLVFYHCDELKYLNLRELLGLQVLSIRNCQKFILVTGWEVATNLASIDIRMCPSYHDFPNVQYLSSLKEFAITRSKYIFSATPCQLSQFSRCAKLRRLVISDDKILSEVVELKNLKHLKFLEFLLFGDCTFSNIEGLSELLALKTLCLPLCTSLRRVLDLGCLKELTKLDMTGSGVEDVVGVEELHLLTWLNLCQCPSLKWLPFLGHLKVLVYLNIWGTSVKEIPGQEGLISLKTLHWNMK